MEGSNRIYAAELAHIMGNSVWTARRFLADLEREHGDAAVGRSGRELYTTWPALEQVTPLRREPSSFEQKVINAHRRVFAALARLEERIVQIETDMAELRTRVARRCV